MAKTKLKDVSVKDLKARRKKNKAQLEKLLKQKKNAKTPKKKKALQAQINKEQERNKKITNVLSGKQGIQKVGKTYDQVLAEVQASPEFQNLSPANKQLLLQVAENYTVEQLKNMKLTKKELKLINKDARLKAKEEFQYTKGQLDLDREETLAQDMSAIETLLNGELAKPYEERNQAAIHDLQTALNTAQSEYEIAAQNKNDYLQTKLGDIEADLSTAVGRADQDELRELKRQERLYKNRLRDVQTSMSQRGLAFSGIRIAEEQEELEEYEDSRTTAEIAAERAREDAKKEAFRGERDIRTLTQQQLAALLSDYGVQVGGYVRGTEDLIGTEQTQALLEGGLGDVEGVDSSSYLASGQTGAIGQQYGQDMTTVMRDFERNFGTEALIEKFGEQAGAKYGYGGFTPTGDITGQVETGYQRDLKTAKEERERKKSEYVDTATAASMFSK